MISTVVVGSAAVLLGVVVGVGGAFVPARYLEPWAETHHEKFDDPRLQLVSAGLLASSGHNMQPWLVSLSSLTASTTRLMSQRAWRPPPSLG